MIRNQNTPGSRRDSLTFDATQAKTGAASSTTRKVPVNSVSSSATPNTVAIVSRTGRRI